MRTPIVCQALMCPPSCHLSQNLPKMFLLKSVIIFSFLLPLIPFLPPSPWNSSGIEQQVLEVSSLLQWGWHACL